MYMRAIIVKQCDIKRIYEREREKTRVCVEEICEQYEFDH